MLICIRRMLYLLTVGLAAETIQLHRQRKEELLRMTLSTARAAEWQAASSEAQVAVDELASASTKDKAVATALQVKVALLEEEIPAKEAAAVAKEGQALELSELAAEETSQANVHWAKSVAEEGIGKDYLAAFVEMTEVAAESSAEANVDEGAVLACQLFPVMDVLCDVVGGLVSTSLEIAAATEAAQTTANFVLYSAVKDEEEAEVVLATDLDAQAAVVEAEAAASHEAATLLFEEEAVEATEMEQDETAAVQKLEEAEAEMEAMAVEESLAMEEEAAAEEAFAESIHHGILAVFYACLEIAAALMAMIIFTFRLIVGFLIPSLSSLLSSRVLVDNGVFGYGGLLSSILFSFSFTIHALTIFALVQASYSSALLFSGQVSQKFLGGTIVELSLFTMTLQSVALSIPRSFISAVLQPGGGANRSLGWCRIFSHLLLDVGLLLGWDAFGFVVLASQTEILPSRSVYYLGPTVLCTAFLHHWLHYNHISKHKGLPLEGTDSQGRNYEKLPISEATYLLPADFSRVQATLEEQLEPQQTKSLVALRHYLLFDLLLTFILCAILWKCLNQWTILSPFWSPAKRLVSSMVMEKWKVWCWWWLGVLIVVVVVCTTNAAVLTASLFKLWIME